MRKSNRYLTFFDYDFGTCGLRKLCKPDRRPSTEDTSVESKADTESAENGTDMENTDNQDVQNHKALVAYFSATGTTKGV